MYQSKQEAPLNIKYDYKNLRCSKIILSLLQNCVNTQALCDIARYLIYSKIWGGKVGTEMVAQQQILLNALGPQRKELERKGENKKKEERFNESGQITESRINDNKRITAYKGSTHIQSTQ